MPSGQRGLPRACLNRSAEQLPAIEHRRAALCGPFCICQFCRGSSLEPATQEQAIGLDEDNLGCPLGRDALAYVASGKTLDGKRPQGLAEGVAQRLDADRRSRAVCRPFGCLRTLLTSTELWWHIEGHRYRCMIG